MSFGNCENLSCKRYGLLYLHIDHWGIKQRLCHNCYLKENRGNEANDKKNNLHVRLQESSQNEDGKS